MLDTIMPAAHRGDNNQVTAELPPSSLEPWHLPKLGDLRDVALQRRVVGFVSNGNEGRSGRIFGQVEGLLFDAVSHGRLFDLGHLPNRRGFLGEAERGARLYSDGHIGHPFDDPYAIFWTYERGVARESSFHLVVPTDPGSREFICTELVPMRIRSRPILVIGDVGIVRPAPDRNAFVGDMYACPARNLDPENRRATSAELLRWASAPVLSVLLLLSTDGVGVDRIVAPDKLNRARARGGKPSIPPHYRVNSMPYVTALRVGAHGHERSEPLGGTHASPLPHLRRGHERRLADGRIVWVRDTMVNFKGEGELRRAFYTLERGGAHG